MSTTRTRYVTTDDGTAVAESEYVPVMELLSPDATAWHDDDALIAFLLQRLAVSQDTVEQAMRERRRIDMETVTLTDFDVPDDDETPPFSDAPIRPTSHGDSQEMPPSGLRMVDASPAICLDQKARHKPLPSGMVSSYASAQADN